ncbi:hypothetical protein CLTEP_06570 [Clostridium tepidiprofundi DSM 19306]|uniref:Uncharacterized protein n=1 Tax=Clostridium tepidiprofundi DSM 19306 TaxID=1121338 RepID=A0A151B6B3_9CLOT|nr:hypothetical protein [Clostridium tepidiprofundi]KYH35481.1 hypothetical protein CLTEP_06570 [Clostridium tepidiprofundi DSM 19306]
MYNSNKKYTIFRSTENIIFKIFINNTNLVIEKYSTQELFYSNVLSKLVLEYSSFMDKNNTIHIAYLTEDFKLNYLTYSNENINQKCLNIPLEINDIYHITLIVCNNIPHIFYISNDNRKFISNMHHCILSNGQCIKKNIISVPYNKYPKSFFIDIYKNFIYIFYNSKKNNVYSLTKLDNTKFILETIEDNISLNNYYNINFLITPKHNIVICYTTLVDRNMVLYLLSKNLNNTNSKFNIQAISDKNSNVFYPILMCSHDKLYCVWLEGNKIVYKVYDTITKIISSKFTLENSSKKIYRCKYMSNTIKDSCLKSTYIYANDSCFIQIKSNQLILKNYTLKHLPKTLMSEYTQKSNIITNICTNNNIKNTININSDNNNTINSTNNINTKYHNLNDKFKKNNDSDDNFSTLTFGKINNSLIEEINSKNSYIKTLERIISYQSKKINNLNNLNRILKLKIKRLSNK